MLTIGVSSVIEKVTEKKVAITSCSKGRNEWGKLTKGRLETTIGWWINQRIRKNRRRITIWPPNDEQTINSESFEINIILEPSVCVNNRAIRYDIERWKNLVRKQTSGPMSLVAAVFFAMKKMTQRECDLRVPEVKGWSQKCFSFLTYLWLANSRQF